MKALNHLLNPSIFQGRHRRRNYFEGWYFKVVNAEQGIAYAFIPGISYDREGRGHAFLQVLDGVAATSSYHEYAVEEFRAATDCFDLRLGPHRFAENLLEVHLPGLRLHLRTAAITPWPRQSIFPGIMGPFGFVPRMECYHGIVSFHHQWQGTLNGREFTATGYTEKDWGTSFPRAWVWAQSSHLSGTTAPACLMLSVARIPWLGSSFTGFLCTFLFEGTLYLFTTWARSRVQCSFLNDEEVHITFTKPAHRLTVVGHPSPGGTLASPIAGAMTGKINESLRGRLEVRLEIEGRTHYGGLAEWAGLEVSEGAQHIL